MKSIFDDWADTPFARPHGTALAKAVLEAPDSCAVGNQPTWITAAFAAQNYGYWTLDSANHFSELFDVHRLTA